MFATAFSCRPVECQNGLYGNHVARFRRVGDKTEIWDLSYQNNMVIAQAFVNNKMVRLYSGTATKNELVLTAQLESESNGTSISANLRILNETTLEGELKNYTPRRMSNYLFHSNGKNSNSLIRYL